MTHEHPITPPPELPQELWDELRSAPQTGAGASIAWTRCIARAYRAGADMELEACIEWLWKHQYDIASVSIRAARRPKPPSLAEEAINALQDQMDRSFQVSPEAQECADLIRRALERLQELENNG